MRLSASLQSEINYSRKLFGAGLNAVSAAGAGRSSEILKQELARSARSAWLPVVMGAAVGLFASRLSGKSKSGRNALVGALAGGVIGFGSAVAWSSREVTAEVVRNAGKNLSAVRDQHWLEKHPVDYA